MQEEKHISFREEDVEPQKHKDSLARRNRLLSTSSSSLASFRLRRIYVASALPFHPIPEPKLHRVSPASQNYLLSQDFEDLAIEKLGTRKITFNLGPFSLPEDEQDIWDARSSSTSIVSSRSGDEKSSLETDDLRIIYSPDGFLQQAEDFTDEDVHRSHVEISKGKGGVFTRSTYRYKSWSAVRSSDLAKADLVVLIWTWTDIHEAKVSLETSGFAPVWSQLDSMKLAASQGQNGDGGIQGNLLILLEALCYGRNLLVFFDLDAGQEREPWLTELETILKTLTAWVTLCHTFEEFQNMLRDTERFVSSPPKFKAISLPVRTNRDALKWLKLITPTK